MLLDKPRASAHRRRATAAARYGRFLQPDPIGHDGGMNLYGYAGADPVNSVDPTGMKDAPRDCPATDPNCPQPGTGNSVDSVGLTVRASWGDMSAGLGGAGGAGAGPVTDSSADDIVVTAEPGVPNDDTRYDGEIVVTGFRLAGSQRGGNNFRSSEFRGKSDEQLKEDLKGAKGQQRLKIVRELKARRLRNIMKFRGRGIFRFSPPILIFPGQEILLRCRPGNNDPACRVA